MIQVPMGDWAGTLGRGRGRGTEIPCRRMRSGSYVKAMGDLEDSEDSEGSPKPSPKASARRQSYLKATQHSLSEQQPPLAQRKWVQQHNESYWNDYLDYHAHWFAIVVFVLLYIHSNRAICWFYCWNKGFVMSPKAVSRWQHPVTNNVLDAQQHLVKTN